MKPSISVLISIVHVSLSHVFISFDTNHNSLFPTHKLLLGTCVWLCLFSSDIFFATSMVFVL